MTCRQCHSEIQGTFVAELKIHFPGRDGLTKPGVMASSKLVVCLVCGFAESQLEETEVLELIEHSGRLNEFAAARKRERVMHVIGDI
jgi:hypothetical protein